MDMFANFTEETCTGTGATLALAGATTGRIEFSKSFADGDLVAYVLEDSGGTIITAGVGTYVSVTDDITRNDTWNWNGTVIDENPSTNITLNGGIHTVRCSPIDNQLIGLIPSNPAILGLDPDGTLTISSSASPALGGNIVLYGDTHGTKAKDIEFRADAGVELHYDDSVSKWDFSANKLDTSGAVTFSGGGALTGTWSDLGTVITIDLNGGTIDGTVIGGSAAAAGAFAALVATTAVLSGILSVDDTTDSTSGTTGSIHTDGGLGVAKDIVVGDNLDATTSNITLYGGATSPGKITLARRLGLANYRMEIGRIAGNNNNTQFNFIGPSTDQGGVEFRIGDVEGVAAEFNILRHNGTSVMRLTTDGSMTLQGEIAVGGTTDSTSATNGSIQTGGGLGVVKNIIGGALVKCGSGATGSRPTPRGTGSMWFDTTLGKPIWHDGTNWVDATGATV